MRESLIALNARWMRKPIPNKDRIPRTIQFWTKAAVPAIASMAQAESPISDPIWTRSAGQNPRANPRRRVSAVTTPGGAQKAMASTKDEKKRDISLWERPRLSLGLSVLPFFRQLIYILGQQSKYSANSKGVGRMRTGSSSFTRLYSI